MSKFLLFSKINAQKPVTPHTKKWYYKFTSNYFRLNIICLGVLIVLFIAYIGLINTTTSASYELTKIQEKIETMESQNRELELSVESLQSMEHIKDIKENFALTEVEEVSYLGGTSTVALSE
jgi:cell division protein FtsL